MNREKKIDFIISFLFYAVIAICAVLIFKFLITPLLPFILAFAVAALSQKAVNAISSKTFLSRKVSVSLFTLLLILSTSLAIYGIMYSLFRELSVLSKYLSNTDFSLLSSSLSNSLSSFFGKFESVKGIGPIAAKLQQAFTKADEVIIKSLSQYIPVAVTFLIKFLGIFPKAMIFVTFFIISLFYIGFDYNKITDFFKLQISGKFNDGIQETFFVFTSTLRKITKAYVLLTSMTFFQLLSGFLILKIKYAFVLSLAICIIDLLPILGTGTILIPWSIICFISGDIPRSAGILTLYIIITVLRQFIEPKIVGAHIGLSPLLSLISIYMGLKLFGFFGIVLFPIFLITIISLNEKGIIKLYKNPPETGKSKANKVKKKFLDFKKYDGK